MALLIPIGFISLRQLRNESLSLSLRLATMAQVLLLYSTTTQICFQEYLPLTKLGYSLFLQSLWQSVGLEYFFARMSSYGKMKEEEAIRRQFGLGAANSKKEGRFKFLHSILAQQLFQAAYFFLTVPLLHIQQQNLQESFMLFYVAVFQGISLIKGLPLLIDGILSQIKLSKEAEYEEIKTELEEEGLLWGRGLMARRIQLSNSQKVKSFFKKFGKKAFWLVNLMMILWILLSLALLVAQIQLQYELIILPAEVSVLLRVMLVIYTLIIGNEMIHKERTKKRIPQGKIYQEKLAAEGSRHLSRMISCSFAFISMLSFLIKTEEGQFRRLIQTSLGRPDILVLYSSIFVFTCYTCLKKIVMRIL